MIQTGSFSPLYNLFRSYCEAYTSTFDVCQADLAREVGLLLRDLEFLRERILEGLSREVSAHEAEVNAMFAQMRDQLMKDPLTAQIFTNPNVERKTLGFGYAYDPVLSPDTENPSQRGLRLDTEFYYYKAHRLITILQCLPGLRKTECKQIAIVRNQLLEHAERQPSGVTYPGFAVNPEVGPIIKGTRRGDQAGVHEDQGFAANHAALLEVLSEKLKRAAAYK